MLINFQVLAIEPVLENIHRLQKASQIDESNSKITLLQNAISDTHQNSTLLIPVDNQGGGYIYSNTFNQEGVQSGKVSCPQGIFSILSRK